MSFFELDTYELLKEQTLHDIHAQGYILRHKKSGARLALISNELGKYSVTITYFLPDKRKSGGEYVTACDFVKKIDVYEKKVVLAGGVSVPVDDIFKIEI